MNLPRQVQEREEKANQALERMARGDQEGISPKPDATPPPKDPIAQAPAVDWEARYKSLQGKYNAEVPRLSELVRNQQAQIETAKAEIEGLKKRVPAADTRIDLTASLPDEVRDRYDPDMLSTMSQIAEKAVEESTKESRMELERAREERAQQSAKLLNQQRQSEMLDALTELSPNWDAIDKLADFSTFLKQIDPATGKPLQDTLTASVQRFDAATAARIFNRFESTLKQPIPAPQSPNLAAQQVPDIAGAGSSTPDGGKRVFTPAEAKAEYTRSAGLRNTNPKRADEIERDIDLAYSEGRVR